MNVGGSAFILSQRVSVEILRISKSFLSRGIEFFTSYSVCENLAVNLGRVDYCKLLLGV